MFIKCEYITYSIFQNLKIVQKDRYSFINKYSSRNSYMYDNQIKISMNNQ